MTTFTVAEDVYGIDVGLFDSGVTAVYLFDDEEATLVDAGTARSVETIKQGMAECSVAPEELRNIVLSHVHVDHSGGASKLVEEAPSVDVYIHESTASHLIDPDRLIESSKRAMGDHFELMGEQGPVPEANVVPVSDTGTTIDIGRHDLEIHHAPGHSPDHCAVWNPEQDFLFAAECLGCYLARADRWLPPVTLPNFDLDVIASTIDELRALDPATTVFPHFGVWPRDSRAAFETARTVLERFDRRIREYYSRTGTIDGTKRLVAEELVDITPPYAPEVERFFVNLITDGLLRYHGIE